MCCSFVFLFIIWIFHWLSTIGSFSSSVGSCSSSSVGSCSSSSLSVAFAICSGSSCCCSLVVVSSSVCVLILSSSKYSALSSVVGCNILFIALYSSSSINSALFKSVVNILYTSFSVGVGGCASSGVVGSCIVKYCVFGCSSSGVWGSCIV